MILRIKPEIIKLSYDMTEPHNIDVNELNTKRVQSHIAYIEQMVDRMTLSERDTDLFLSAVGRLDNILRAAGYITDDAQRDILKQQMGREISVDDILANAVRRLFTRMERANHFDSVLTELKNGGALIVDAGAPYIPPMDMDGLPPATNDNATKYEVKTEPRLSWAVEHLRAIGIYADDMIIRVGRVDPSAMRKYPYIVIDIPRVNKQIALCEQVGNKTFVSNEILDPSTYERLTKDLLQTLPSIAGIRMSPTWGQDICNIITGADDEPQRKIKNLEFFEAARKPKPMLLSEDIILQACKEWHAEYEEWPTNDSGLIGDGALKGSRWGNLDHALRRGGFGLEKGKYKGLADFMEAHGLKIGKHSLSRHLTEEMILQGCYEWHNKYGQWPKAISGKIIEGVLSGNNWQAINLALSRGARGLPAGKYKGIVDFLDQYGLKVSRYSVGRRLTEEAILQGCHEWFAKYGEWPTKGSGEIISGILVENSWKMIHYALEDGGRGLEKGKYKGLGDFKKQHGLVDGATPDTAADFARAANPDYQVPESSSKITSPLFPPLTI
jgi:hypothetical protein